MAELLSTITTILPSATGWLGTIVTTVTETPLLLLGVSLPFVGFGVGLFKRLLNL